MKFGFIAKHRGIWPARTCFESLEPHQPLDPMQTARHALAYARGFLLLSVVSAGRNDVRAVLARAPGMRVSAQQR